MAQVKVNDITLPEHYVREAIRASHVNDLLDVVAKHNGVTDWKELIGKKVNWPFPEIELGKNLTPKPEKAKKGEKKNAEQKIDSSQSAKGKKRWFPFEIIDGGHRWTVAKRLKMKEIDSITRSIDDPGDRFFHQYQTNIGHGLRLDKDARDNSVRTLAKVYNWSQKKLVEKTGLDVSSVSRIINSKQRKEGPRKKAEKKTQPSAIINEGSRKPTAEGMSVQGFLERLQQLVEEFPSLTSSILAYLVTLGKDKHPKLLEFAGKVRDIAAIIDDATKKESQPNSKTTPKPELGTAP